ncbi:MAG: hypothetical protein ACP6IS_03280 [Candidatus Asgardarchaeia archaeon]
MSTSVGYAIDEIPHVLKKAIEEKEAVAISDSDNLSSTLLALNMCKYFIKKSKGQVIYLFSKRSKFFEKILQINTLSKSSEFIALDIRKPFFSELSSFTSFSYFNLADFFKELYSKVISLSKNKPSMVVLDSVDYVINTLKLNEPFSVFDFLKRFVELLSSIDAIPVILLLNDSPAKKYLNMFVNLSIELRRVIHHQRLLNYVVIYKAVPTEQFLPTFTFTTENYKFRYFKEILFRIPSKERMRVKIPKFRKNLFPVPIKGLNEIVNGGLIPGDTIVLEIDPRVYKYYRHIIFLIELAFVENEHPCILIPAKGTSHSLIKKVFESYLSNREKLSWLRFVSIDHVIHDEVVLNIARGTLLEDIKRILRHIKSSMNNKVAFIYISGSRLIEEYGSTELSKSIGHIINLIRETENIAVVSFTSPLLKNLSLPRVSYNFRLDLIKNTPIFYGMNPITPLFVPITNVDHTFEVELVSIT